MCFKTVERSQCSVINRLNESPRFRPGQCLCCGIEVKCSYYSELHVFARNVCIAFEGQYLVHLFQLSVSYLSKTNISCFASTIDWFLFA